MDTFFAVACVILAGCLCAVIVYANGLRMKLDGVNFACLMMESDLRQWRAAYESRAAQLAEARTQLAKFDHDGDGKPGGSLKRRMTDEELEAFGRQWRSHEDVCTEPVSYVDKARGRAEGR